MADTIEIQHEAVETVLQRRPDYIILEGSPIYFHPEHPSQHWESIEFQRGWEIAAQIWDAALGAEIPVSHWVLADNYNNRPDPSAYRFEFPEELAGHEHFNQLEIDHLFYESDFAETGKDSCSRMDAQFQIRKLEEAYMSGARPLVISVHPESFQSQQIAMFDFLQSEIKRGEVFAGVPKGERKRFLEETFMHVWVNEFGEVSSITQPKWNYGGQIDHYGHQPIQERYEN